MRIGKVEDIQIGDILVYKWNELYTLYKVIGNTGRIDVRELRAFSPFITDGLSSNDCVSLSRALGWLNRKYS